MRINHLTGLSLLAAVLLSLAPGPISVQAADHGDAPSLAHDQGADIADLFFFLDPNDNTQAVLIATFHGFIAPGEASNFAIYDPAIRYRFEIYNDHVNLTPPGPNAEKKETKSFIKAITPNKTIDVTFSQRVAIVEPNHPDKLNLQIPQPQVATVKFSGFEGMANKGIFTGLPATNPSLAAGPPAQVVTPIDTGVGTVSFFAGEVDDPFFFDIPAFSAFIASVRNGAPNAAVFDRARDTFAGYNIMSIAFRMPVALLQGTNGTIVGADFFTQRGKQTPGKDGAPKFSGKFVTVDRIGNPAVNVALIPFNTKNLDNTGTPRQDALGRFAPDIVETLTELGTDATHIGILADVAVTFGDILRLETNPATKPNTGAGGGDNAGSGFPNGRRLKDDTVDTLLFLVTNEALTTGDKVNASDVAPNDTFPFVHEAQQPRATGVVDDNTRN
jgi:hypothetical protein